MSERPPILLLPIEPFDDDFLASLIITLKEVFATDVSQKKINLDITDYFDPARRQYNANNILKAIEQLESDPGYLVIGLMNIDLFIPIFTFIFGQAAYNGRHGIVSVYRLRNEFYGLEADPQLLLERTQKVIIHELGHIFGLIHCINPECVMRSSTYVEDIDQKEHRFCTSCALKLEMVPT